MSTQQAEATEQDNAIDYEGEASEMGWTPKEKFRGNPEKWIDAQTFVENAEKSLPLAKAMNKKLQSELREVKQSIDEFKNYAERDKANAVRAAIAESERKRLIAVEAGDTVAFKKHEEDKKLLEAQMPNVQDAGQIEFNGWLKNNEWAKDPEAAALASAIATRLQGDGGTVLETLEKTKQQMQKKYPQFFPELINENRRNSADVGSSSKPVKKGEKSYAALSSEAKAECDRQVKYLGIKREDWVKNYDWE